MAGRTNRTTQQLIQASSPVWQVVGAHYESVERSDFRLCTRCYQHEISTEQLTPGAHPMQRITKDAHAQVRVLEE